MIFFTTEEQDRNYDLILRRFSCLSSFLPVLTSEFHYICRRGENCVKKTISYAVIG